MLQVQEQVYAYMYTVCYNTVPMLYGCMTYLYITLCVCVCACMHVCVRVCVCVCVCV